MITAVVSKTLKEEKMEKAVKMIVYDADDPSFVVRLEAPTPGHFNYIEPAFVQCFPKYKKGRFTLVVQEVDEFPKDRAIASKPQRTSCVSYCGELTDGEFVDLVAGTKPPDMTKKGR